MFLFNFSTHPWARLNYHLGLEQNGDLFMKDMASDVKKRKTKKGANKD